MIQVIYAVILLLVILGILYILYKKRSHEDDGRASLQQNSIDKLLDLIKRELTEATREDDVRVFSDEDYEAVFRNKVRLGRALRDCVFGIESEVRTVKAAIRDIVERQLPTQEKINEVIDFGSIYELEPMVKWELLVYIVEQKIQDPKVLQYLDEHYKISAERVINDGLNLGPRRCFDEDLLDIVFRNEVTQDDISYAVSLDVLVIILFSKFKGLRCVQTLRYMPIDGFHYGTSGSIRYRVDKRYDAPYRDTNSVWVQLDAKWIHFSFLDFNSIEEMYIVNSLISAWGRSMPLNEKQCYKVVDGYDGARIAVIQPPAGESCACFVRMFSLVVRSMDWWFDKPGVKNWQLPRRLIYFLMQAEITTAFTGGQNTGKSTLSANAIGDVKNVNIRCLEMAFELALREAFPGKDILTVKPTEYVSASNLQDFLKKTDAYLSMVGEVAEDIVAAIMIQFCIIASAFTLFTHHGITDEGLIYGLSQSCVACGMYKDHDVAVSTVLDAIKSNVHLKFLHLEDSDKVLRYVEYISEIQKEDTIQKYPEVEELLAKAKSAYMKDDEKGLAQVMLAYMSLTREYYTRRTDRIKFTSRKIIVFDKETLTYKPNDWYSPEMFTRILDNLQGDTRRQFLEFYYDNWRPNEMNPYRKEIAPDEQDADLC